MHNFISAIVLTIFVFATSNAYAQQINLNLAPNASKKMTNHYSWTLSATCTVQTKATNKIRFSVLDNKGTVNGKNLNEGQTTSVVVKNNDSISVSAEPGTEVTLQNLSDDPIQATCAT